MKRVFKCSHGAHRWNVIWVDLKILIPKSISSKIQNTLKVHFLTYFKQMTYGAIMHETKEIMPVTSTSNLFSRSVVSQNVPWKYFLLEEYEEVLISPSELSPYIAPLSTSSSNVGLFGSHLGTDEIHTYRNHRHKLGNCARSWGYLLIFPKIMMLSCWQSCQWTRA